MGDQVHPKTTDNAAKKRSKRKKIVNKNFVKIKNANVSQKVPALLIENQDGNLVSEGTMDMSREYG
jgi:hypothetical protein